MKYKREKEVKLTKRKQSINQLSSTFFFGESTTIELYKRVK